MVTLGGICIDRGSGTIRGPHSDANPAVGSRGAQGATLIGFLEGGGGTTAQLPSWSPRCGRGLMANLSLYRLEGFLCGTGKDRVLEGTGWG